jgi:hypothetical protein
MRLFALKGLKERMDAGEGMQIIAVRDGKSLQRHHSWGEGHVHGLLTHEVESIDRGKEAVYCRGSGYRGLWWPESCSPVVQQERWTAIDGTGGWRVECFAWIWNTSILLYIAEGNYNVLNDKVS